MKVKTHKIYEHTIYCRYTKNLPYNPNLKQRAKELRKARNLSEVLFWLEVHKNKFWQIDFDRQRIIGNYIVDFYIKSLSLVIEIDGSSHIGKEEYVQQREEYLKDLGLNIYRIDDFEVKTNLIVVIEMFRELYYTRIQLATTRPSGTPLSRGELVRTRLD